MPEQPVWITFIPEDERPAPAAGKDLPLAGLTFAVKDNIDVAGVPTTAGCQEFAYVPSKSAAVVERLVNAGAIPAGKTNMDQFATGLVGTRSPYGACSSVYDSRYISGGSSSGSAVAVASGLVDFALGTDTAGSGRIPASFNNLIGLKPTRGALSNAGVVPACRTLDCVSIFAKDIPMAARVFAAAREPVRAQRKAWPATGFRFGVPHESMLRFFGDESAPALFRKAISRFETMGGRRVEIDFAPFRDAAHLLYSGPWVAERLAAIREFASTHPDALHPVTAKIILGASRFSAVETFAAMYRLEDFWQAAAVEWQKMDFMLLPTAGAAYTHDQIGEEPIVHNTDLGYYTNFVNLLDLAALAVPAGIRSNGIPFGVTLIGPAWSDEALLHTAAQDHPYCPAGYVPLAVCGAHLSGQPLNHQLTSAGAFLIEATQTSPEYRLYALGGTVPPKPGLLFSPGHGSAIEVEVWAVPENTFGPFVAAVPGPLAIGTGTLASGRKVKSFVCEPAALENGSDITHLRGWRSYLSNLTAPKV